MLTDSWLFLFLYDSNLTVLVVTLNSCFGNIFNFFSSNIPILLHLLTRITMLHLLGRSLMCAIHREMFELLPKSTLNLIPNQDRIHRKLFELIPKSIVWTYSQINFDLIPKSRPNTHEIVWTYSQINHQLLLISSSIAIYRELFERGSIFFKLLHNLCILLFSIVMKCLLKLEPFLKEYSKCEWK